MDQEDIVKKAEQFVQKNKQLLDQKKYYQFAQKAKLISHRKLQSKKTIEAVFLLKQASNTLLTIQEVEQNAALQLIDQLVEALAKQPQLFTQDLEKSFLSLIQKRPITSRKIQIVKSLIDKTEKTSKNFELKSFYINYYVKNCSFADVLKMACQLTPEKSYEFIQKWTSQKQILKSQIPGIWCRMVLIRGLLHGIEDGQQIFRKVTKDLKNYENDQPYTIFTGFLLKVVRINSKQAYQTLQRSYSQFLESDPFFKGIFSNYGKKFFGIDKSKSGIMSLIS